MLIIDGSVTVGKLFAQIFQNRGWRVSTCNDADCAMDRLAGSAPYDVVLLSYRVPGADGVKLVRFIRALEHRVTAAVLMAPARVEWRNKHERQAPTMSCSNRLTQTL